ncbi:MAG: hypothetical protein PHP98_05150 [Kiritimatiellae bacterium]|nr:hypothetical protein [Kiritimatiellia bacterium]
MNKNANSVYDLNRPVHLARSSAFIEKSRRLFQECAGKTPAKRRVQLIEGSLYYLQSALEHSTLAAKSTRTNPLEESFMAFIRMMLICMYSARLLLDNELQLDDRKSPLWQFLHLRGKINQTVKFARSGEQLLDDAAHLFKLSQEPVEDLRRSLLEDMNEEERKRYKLAYEELRAHLARERRIPSSGTFLPFCSANRFA